MPAEKRQVNQSKPKAEKPKPDPKEAEAEAAIEETPASPGISPDVLMGTNS